MICKATPRLRISAKAFFTTALLFSCAGAKAESPDKLLEQGEALEARLETSQALASYLAAEKIEPDNADVLVRIARQYRHLMSDAASSDEKLRLGGIALVYGRRAAALAPDDSDAQLSCAISYGKMVPFQSSREQMTCSKLIKEGAEKAIRLDAENDVAWHILGRWYRAVANVGTLKRALASVVYEKLPPASNEEAVNCFERAIKINPNRMMHHIELGRTYVQMGRKDDARRCLQKGLVMPILEKDDIVLKADGRQVLASLR